MHKLSTRYSIQMQTHTQKHTYQRKHTHSQHCWINRLAEMNVNFRAKSKKKKQFSFRPSIQMQLPNSSFQIEMQSE